MMLAYIIAAAASMIAAITHLFMIFVSPGSSFVSSATYGPKSRPRIPEKIVYLFVLICIRNTPT